MISILADDKNLVTYRPRIKIAIGSMTSAVLLQQILYWWKKKDGKPFYKFIEPCGHQAYRKGDSWSEELGFTKKEFSTAFKKLVKLKLVESTIDHTRLTKYNVLEYNAEKFLSYVYSDEYGKMIGMFSIPKLPLVTKEDLSDQCLLSYVTNGNLYTIYTETTQETNVLNEIQDESDSDLKQETGLAERKKDILKKLTFAEFDKEPTSFLDLFSEKELEWLKIGQSFRKLFLSFYGDIDNRRFNALDRFKIKEAFDTFRKLEDLSGMSINEFRMVYKFLEDDFKENQHEKFCWGKNIKSFNKLYEQCSYTGKKAGQLAEKAKSYFETRKFKKEEIKFTVPTARLSDRT